MHQFDRDIKLHTETDRLFSGIIADNWSINGVPDGGYLMAILTRAMMNVSDMQSTPIITANYLGRCEPGSVRVSVEKLATSRQFNRLQATLHQNGEKKIRAFGTFAGESNECVFRTRFITCGLLEEDGEIWDQNDQLIAISNQIAQYRTAS